MVPDFNSFNLGRIIRLPPFHVALVGSKPNVLSRLLTLLPKRNRLIPCHARPLQCVRDEMLCVEGILSLGWRRGEGNSKAIAVHAKTSLMSSFLVS
jgi:hypothetical protein